MSEHEISSITKEEYAYVITLSDGTCWVQRACPRTGVDYPMSDYEVLLLAMIRERDRLAAENAAWAGAATYGNGSPCMTPADLEQAIKDFISERDRLQARVAELEKAWNAAKAFIESHVADWDITDEMTKNYHAYQEAKAALERSDDA